MLCACCMLECFHIPAPQDGLDLPSYLLQQGARLLSVRSLQNADLLHLIRVNLCDVGHTSSEDPRQQCRVFLLAMAVYCGQ